MRYKVLAKDATITLTIRISSVFASCTIPFTQAEFCSSSHVASLLIQKIYLTLYRWILLIVHSFYIFTRKVLLGDFVQPSTISLHIRFSYFTWTTVICKNWHYVCYPFTLRLIYIYLLLSIWAQLCAQVTGTYLSK